MTALVATESVAFIVLGKPQPKQRARLGKGGRVFTPAETRRYEAVVRDVATLYLGRWRKDGLYRLTVEAVFDDNRRRDADNVLKAVSDALNGVGYDDDNQVVESIARKMRADSGGARTIVLLERVGDAPARKLRRKAVPDMFGRDGAMARDAAQRAGRERYPETFPPPRKRGAHG